MALGARLSFLPRIEAWCKTAAVLALQPDSEPTHHSCQPMIRRVEAGSPEWGGTRIASRSICIWDLERSSNQKSGYLAVATKPWILDVTCDLKDKSYIH